MSNEGNCSCGTCRESRATGAAHEREAIINELKVFMMYKGTQRDEQGIGNAIRLIKERGTSRTQERELIDERMGEGPNAATPQGAQAMAVLINRLIDAVNKLDGEGK